MERKVIPSSELSSGHGVWLRINGDPSANATNEEGTVLLVTMFRLMQLSDFTLCEGIWDGNGDPPFWCQPRSCCVVSSIILAVQLASTSSRGDKSY